MEHCAQARSLNLPISTKHSVEISKSLRFRSVAYAKKFLEGVAALDRAVPFHRFKRDVGHKPGMAAGRFPQKAACAFLRLMNSVEANAQAKGLNSSSLKIVKLVANKAAIPMTGGRNRSGTKRTHLEVVVAEVERKEKKEKKVKAAVEKKDVTSAKKDTAVKAPVEKEPKPVKKQEVAEKKVEVEKPQVKVAATQSQSQNVTEPVKADIQAEEKATEKKAQTRADENKTKVQE